MPRKPAKAKATAKTAAPSSLVVERVPIDSVRPDAKNAKRHGDRDLAVTGGSLEEFGQVEPLIVWNGIVIGGNGRLEAMKSRGWTEVDIHRVDHLTEPQARKLAIVLNRSSQLAGWNEEVLQETLADLAKLDVDVGDIGFSADEIDAIMRAAAVPTPTESSGGASDAAPPAEAPIPTPPGKPRTRKGDVWILGSHRLLCGDSTLAEDVGKVIGDRKINLAFTSPPYASQRKYDETSGFKPIHPDAYVDWWEPIQANVKAHLATDGSFFVNIKAESSLDDGRSLYVYDLVIAHVREWGWRFEDEFCWERNGIPGDAERAGKFKNQWESVFWFSTQRRPKFHPKAVMIATDAAILDSEWQPGLAHLQGGESAIGASRKKGEGLAYPGNRLPTFAGSHEALGHAAAFPVGLPSFFIQAYTDAGDTVFEPFCGSGSTLIAAENLKRDCRAIEISPAYCDVIVKRWENLTGKKAERERASRAA